MMLKIESLQNESVKLACRLAASAKARQEENAFFLEGLRLCSDAVQSGVRVLQCFVTEAALERGEARLFALVSAAERTALVSPAVAQKLSQTQSPQGVFCVCEMPRQTADVDPNGVYIALDHVQDPANLGAVIRTAEALGLSGAVLCGCCDVYNPKAQRAAMGSLLRLQLTQTDDLTAFLPPLRARGMRLLATTPDASAQPLPALSVRGGVIAVIGNEANGVSPAVLALCERVTIPMNGRAESLNASMAAAITMWELVRAR
ncbi:MAG: RNA methyltransferase [Clostridia bacterium]|nr:RNA methyltransferase [Clostridia bacterium]